MGALLSSAHCSHGVSSHCNQSEGAGDGGKAQPEGKRKIGKGNEEKCRCTGYFYYHGFGDHVTCQNLLRYTI